jgi:hypothetical protein
VKLWLALYHVDEINGIPEIGDAGQLNPCWKLCGGRGQTIAAYNTQDKCVSVYSEMACGINYTPLLRGMGLRSFSMPPQQLLAVKQ